MVKDLTPVITDPLLYLVFLTNKWKNLRTKIIIISSQTFCFVSVAYQFGFRHHHSTSLAPNLWSNLLTVYIIYSYWQAWYCNWYLFWSTKSFWYGRSWYTFVQVT